MDNSRLDRFALITRLWPWLFLAALLVFFVLSGDDAADQEMRQAVHGETELAVLAIGDLDPLHFPAIHDVVAAEANGQARLVETEAKQIINVALDAFLKNADRGYRNFADPAAVIGPAAIAVVESDDDTAVRDVQTVQSDQRLDNRIPPLGDIFRADFVREAPVFGELNITRHVAAVAEEGAAALANAFTNLGVARTAACID